MRHGSQPFAADWIGGINYYFGVRAHWFIYHPCAHCHISGVPGWAQYRVEESWWCGLVVGAVVDCNCPLNCLNLVVQRGKWLPFPRLEASPHLWRIPHWWHINGDPINVKRMELMQTRWFVLFLARALAPNLNDSIQSFSSQLLISCQWLSNQVTLKDRMSGANLQMEGHMDVPSQSTKNLGESGALHSSPSCLPSWSPARRPLSSCPNTKHCWKYAWH